ncbi:MAG: apolipoprotein N-acyltransferase [Hyphomicrobiales bacterium]
MNESHQAFLKWLSALSARKTAFFAFVLGAVASLAMAPLHWSPVLFISFSGFFLLLDSVLQTDSTRQKLKRAGWLGWCFGFGFFLSGLWWVGAAVLVEADQFAWALPFAVAGLPAGLALFWGLAAGLSSLFWRSNLQKICALTTSYTAAEFARGHLLTGFPWNVVGYGAMPSPVFMQSASLLGLWGITLLTIFIAYLPALLLVGSNHARRWRPALVLILVTGTLSAHVGFGMWRLSDAATKVVDNSAPLLRLVQPNISQEDKWRSGNEDAVFQSYLDLTSTPGLDKVSSIIWPESAFPFLIMQTPDALARIGRVLPENTQLLTGAVRVKPPEMKFSNTPPKLKFFNSLLVFDDKGQRQEIYDKQRLVPFGEFLPFGDTLEQWGITNLVNVPGGFAEGSNGNFLEFSTLNSAGMTLPPAAVLICYEAIFPGSFNVSHPTNNSADEPSSRAEWLLNITNDAWFGKLAGPYQHFHQARLRAVEQGLPLVRVANTGISAMIDPFGRIVQKIGMDEIGIIDVALPGALSPTYYANAKDLAFATLMAFFCAILLISTFFKKLGPRPRPRVSF